ncbi:MAG: hypothetical protein QNI84_14175 [Henriciella sp.]|nr:hypothetical protein [Henriciella sp.]
MTKKPEFFEFAKKLDALFTYANSKPQNDYPTTAKALVKELRSLGHLTNASRISDAKSLVAPKYLSTDVHAAILQVYELKWPCIFYLDVEALGNGERRRDTDAKTFYNFLFPSRDPVEIEASSVVERKNSTPFPNPRLFVFDLEQVETDDHSWSGLIVAKPMVMPLSCGREELTESQNNLVDTQADVTSNTNQSGEEKIVDPVFLGCVSLGEFRIDMSLEGDIEVERETERTIDSNPNLSVREVGTKAAPAWMVANYAPAQPLNENVKIMNPATFTVTRMALDASFTLGASIQTPFMRVALNPDLESTVGRIDSELRTKIERIAERKIEKRIISSEDRVIDMGSERYVRKQREFGDGR